MSRFAIQRPEVLDFLLSRRSHPCVTMSEPGPSDYELSKILTAASRVPDHGKLSPWRFIVYRPHQGEIIGRKLAELSEAEKGPLDDQRKEQELTRFTRAPLVIGVVSQAAVHPKIPVWEQQLSAGAVCISLLNAASACGYASQWITEWYCFDTDAARYLGCTDQERFAGFIHIGTPTQAPFERPRPDVSAICTDWQEG